MRSAVAQPILQRLFLAAVDFDHVPLTKKADLVRLGDPPEWHAGGRSLSVSSQLKFMSRDGWTSPVQRSVRAGPGLPHAKLMLSLPYRLASDSVRRSLAETNTLHFSTEQRPYLLLPVIPPK